MNLRSASFAPTARFALGGAVVLAAVVALVVEGAADAAPRTARHGMPPVGLPGPGERERPVGADVAAANAACERCHADIAQEWRGSMHQEAWTDPVFQEAYDIEPLAFCRSCHAPESDPESMPTAAAQAMGVSCTTCHVQMAPGGAGVGVIVGAHGTPSGSPHAVLADARMAAKEACASCHQFDFPRVAGAPMQDTVAEHASSKFSSTPCQTCHMPERLGKDGKKHKSHAFSVIRDPDMIRSAATATAERTGAKGIRVAIAPKGAGHAFPTGDMFRRLEVRAVAVDPVSRKMLARSDEVHLGRTFGDKVQGPHVFMTERVEVADTRLPPPGTSPGASVELRFPTGIRAAEVHWQLVYQRMSTAMAASFGVDQARDEVVVAEGRLAPVQGARGEQR